MSRETRRALACALLSAALLAGWLVPPASAQDRKRKPVVVSFGQPSVWSLEQAHYLLARMHQENLELRARSLAALDPNETHATRIQILKQLLEIGAEFDEGIALQNSRITRQNEFNDTRRLELISGRDRLRSDALRTRLDINRLELERARMTEDNSTEEERDLKDAELKRRRDDLTVIESGITTHNEDITSLSSSQPAGTPTAPTPSTTPFDKNRLPASILEKIGDEKLAEIFKEAAGSAKLNATTQLDNHVQMQYEIIAKQLTLLRDEVGPGERLVFLELPQSVYTTPGSGDEKMAQAWWHVNGYTRTDPLLRLLLELYEVELKWRKIQDVPAYRRLASDMPPDGSACTQYANEFGRSATGENKDNQGRERVLRETFLEFQCEYENARSRLFKDLFREARSDFARAQQGGARDTSELVQSIREALAVSPPSDERAMKQINKRAKDRDEDAADELGRHVDSRDGVRTAAAAEDRRQAMIDGLLCLLSDPNLSLDRTDPDNPKLVQSGTQRSCGNLEGLDFKKGIFKKGIEYVRMDGRADRGSTDGRDDGVAPADIELRTVRTVDIIPRQSALNVNDIQNTVKATGILAAFKFLFGFAGQVNYMRQREQFEQFIHQELYASGFGKGNRDFGWTFGALPGTKRVAPGVRTTYAVLVVPDDAESLVLSARGCYFPRRSYQPLDFEDTSHKDWDRESRLRYYNCNDEQTYIIPVPGGGDRSNFWVTHVDYMAAADGQRATVSIRGKNFSTQMGVLVNGVPLWPAVGLAQPLLAARARTDANEETSKILGLGLPRQDCATAQNAAQNSGPKVCGNYERIDPEQIVITFTVQPSFSGIPTITLVAPGKAVDVNTLPNVTVNGVRNMRLIDSDFVFGARERPHISDFKVFLINPDKEDAYALLTGGGFDPSDEVYVNGELLEPKSATNNKRYREYKSPTLYRLMFPLPPGDKVYVTVLKNNSVPVTREFTVTRPPKKEEPKKEEPKKEEPKKKEPKKPPTRKRK